MSTTASSPALPATMSVPRNVPTTAAIFSTLLRSDLIAQWRNRRATILVILIPSIILISWKGVVEKFGGAFALSNCITIGLMAIGFMGYSNTVARDREKGIFQRLRVTPAPTWTIMGSRILVQLCMIITMTLVLFLVGYQFRHITISAGGYALALVVAIAGGAVYLGIGQAIVGLIRNPETVNVVTRLVYFLFIMVGMFGEMGVLGPQMGEAVKWSPYGCVNRIVAAGLTPERWTANSSMSLLVTVGYTILFAALGIRYFRWTSR
jgi:ABC-2 type transport system permease protein